MVAATGQKPIAVETLAKSLHDCFWSQRQVSEGTTGPLQYEFTKRQVTLCGGGLATRTVWLVMKRTIGENPSSWYYLSNAPLSARLPLFVWLSGLRWAIEQGFEEATTELGMDPYEVRTYPGWHHHMLTTMLAHFCLWHLQIRLGKKSTSADGVTA
jgi:SRSO17 transposase